MKPRVRLRSAALVAAVLLLAAAAHAFIPRADRVVQAVAARNLAAGRAQPLRLDLVLRIEDSPPLGSGVLVTHPTGLARLELRSKGGVVERQVLQGGEHLAMRDGEWLPEPRAFLPPLFLLQTSEEVDLRSGLAQLGADLEAVGLAPCGEADCFVIGDPARTPPRYEPPVPPQPEAAEPEVPESDSGSLAGTGLPPVTISEPGILSILDPGPEAAPEPGQPGPAPASVGPRATLWIDQVRFEPRRFDLQNGVRVWLGPPALFDGVEMPSWIRIDEPGRRSATFDVISVAPVEAPAAAFSRSWLERPQGDEAPPAELRVLPPDEKTR